MNEFITPDTLISPPETGIIKVMELDLSDYRRGTMREDSMKDGEWYTFSTCQSIPRLKLKAGQFNIHFTDTYGQREMTVQLEEDQLTLTSKFNTLKYTKLED